MDFQVEGLYYIILSQIDTFIQSSNALLLVTMATSVTWGQSRDEL